jgi:hypothetical protein
MKFSSGIVLTQTKKRQQEDALSLQGSEVESLRASAVGVSSLAGERGKIYSHEAPDSSEFRAHPQAIP